MLNDSFGGIALQFAASSMNLSCDFKGRSSKGEGGIHLSVTLAVPSKGHTKKTFHSQLCYHSQLVHLHIT